ncbi:hypothetical protein [Paenibacillus sp. GCM10027626]|uniref:hypothetical protein n=1 Tax=Paenibacillus sp. GCM10027626 TaxID=3273411 RepID=UPI0036D20E31
MILKTDMTSMKTDIVSMKLDISSMKLDMTSMKSDMAAMKSDVAAIKENMVTKQDVAALPLIARVALETNNIVKRMESRMAVCK